jgi:site-specific DNA-methyltransferase (adenine-specific)
MIRLLAGDCREVMVNEGPFDLIIADPPYGDTSLPWDRMVAGWEDVARERLKPTGSMWVFGSMRFFLCFGQHFQKRGWSLAQDIVWEKHNGSAFHADRFKRVHEHAVQFYGSRSAWSDVYNEVQTTPDAARRQVIRRRKPPHLGKIGDGVHESELGGSRIMRSVILLPSCHGHAIHPTEKPVDLLQILVRTSCPQGGLVGDFFAGSGAGAEACDASGRSYVGCEIDHEMVEKARRRSLFVNAPVPEPPEDERMADLFTDMAAD